MGLSHLLRYKASNTYIANRNLWYIKDLKKLHPFSNVVFKFIFSYLQMDEQAEAADQ